MVKPKAKERTENFRVHDQVPAFALLARVDGVSLRDGESDWQPTDCAGAGSFLPQRAEHLSQLALYLQNRCKVLLGFQDDRRLTGFDSFGDCTDRVFAHLDGLAGSRVSNILPVGGSQPTGKEARGIRMRSGF